MLKQLLLSSSLALAAAPAFAGSTSVAGNADPEAVVVVMRSGHQMVVRSYRIQGDVAHIIGTDGQPMLIRSEQVDVERSVKATQARVAKLERQRREREQKSLAVERRRQELADLNAARRERSQARAGTVWVAPDLPEPADPVIVRMLPSGEDGDEPLVKRQQEERRAQLTARYNALVEKHNELAEQFRSPTAAKPQILEQLNGIKQELASLKKQIDEIGADSDS